MCECGYFCASVRVCVKCAWRCWHCCLATMFSFFPLRKAFYCFSSSFFCFSAAGGWCHEQTRGILANKLDLPQYTPLRTHTHALNAPYGRNRDLQKEEKGGGGGGQQEKQQNLKLLASCGSVVAWLPSKPSTSTVPSQRQHLNVIMFIHVSQFPTVWPVSY